MHYPKIQGIGIDIIEVERIREASRRWGARFEQRVYTQQELGVLWGYPEPILATRCPFAAKEAALKALGTGLTTGMRWQDVEIKANAVGKPELILHGEVQRYADAHNINAMFVSMSHTNTYAVAQVTLCST